MTGIRPPDPDLLLEIRNLHIHYGAIEAVKGISLTIERGRIVTLLGTNGAGKSTTLRAISGLLRSSAGEIYFDGKPISHTPPHAIVALGVAQSPEGRMIFANLNVRENLEMGAYLRKDKDEVRRDVEVVFTIFPRLKERLHQAGGTLSGGEQQMLAISRALMSRPKLLML